LARVDAAGLLHVGPQSAGAAPGPACYGLGAEVATVTDANVVLGRLPAGLELGGRIRIDAGAARAAVATIASALGGVSLQRAAEGIISLANEHMQQALRVMSVERGVDPRAYTLVSFGGAGGLHVCALADALGMTRALVPAQAGVLSALGMTVARPGRHLSHTLRRPLDAVSAFDIEQGLERLAAGAVAALLAEGHERVSLRIRHAVDVCYRGQSFALTLPWSDKTTLAAHFRDEHRRRYGHDLERALELVNLRVAVDVASVLPAVAAADQASATVPRGLTTDFALYVQAQLVAGVRVTGPAIVLSPVGTAFIDVGWQGYTDEAGNLLLER
jgi:N-methylhydantoinase A